MSSFLQKMKMAAATAKGVIEAQLEGKELLVSDEEFSARLDICSGCPKRIEPIPNAPQCSECGCFLKAKAKLKAATCPEKKW